MDGAERGKKKGEEKRGRKREVKKESAVGFNIAALADASLAENFVSAKFHFWPKVKFLRMLKLSLVERRNALASRVWLRFASQGLFSTFVVECSLSGSDDWIGLFILGLDPLKEGIPCSIHYVRASHHMNRNRW